MHEETEKVAPLITNDAIVLGLLMLILAGVFYTSHSKHPAWKKFYSVVPSLLLCYFIPSVFSTLNIIPGEGDGSQLYFVASRYLLPTSLVLLTLSIDLKAIARLGIKAVGMFLAGTIGIVIGGPVALLIVSAISPDFIGANPDDVWRGMSTIAGSWIGGGANQAAMKEMWQPSGEMFSIMATVDVIVANIWMATLLFGIAYNKRLNRFFKGDDTAIEDLRKKVEDYQASIAKMPTLTDLMIILGVGFSVTGVGHIVADAVAPFLAENYPGLAQYSLTSGFFWLIVVATLGGVGLSFTRARKLEGVGASRMGSALIYILVATIGMYMDLYAIVEYFQLFVVGIIWMLVHVIILFIAAKLMKAPYFFIAVGSQANVGGAASAPIVASAFNPALAPVGALLAVLGYAIGTFGAYICALLMQAVATG